MPKSLLGNTAPPPQYLLGDGSVMSSYTPTLRERGVDLLRGLLFSDDREGQQKAQKVSDVLEFSPYGVATGMYDAGRAGGQGDYATAGTMLAMAGLPGPNPKGFRAYHGSPHSFDKFDISKIGTGEGAQAYGHGLYFADSEGVAKSYRDALTNKAVPQGSHIEKVAFNVVRNAPDMSDAELAPFVRNVYPNASEQEIKAALDTARANQQIGSMYEVQINADPNSFLDWDKPLSEQPKGVRKAVKEVGLDSPDWVKGGDIHEYLGNYVGNYADSDAGVRELLKKHKVPGIKYLDAGSRTKGDGSRNYVVFDDKLIEILRKYGWAGLLGLPALADSEDQKG
jgi:hypothetical protein